MPFANKGPIDPDNAFLQLRARCGQSQQVFATQLGISIVSVQNIECGKSPGIRTLIAYCKHAQENGHTELLETIGTILEKKFPGLKVHFEEAHNGHHT